MTMLSAVSVPEGIVISADSSVSNGESYMDKIFADTKNHIAFMIYNNASNFYNFQVKYSHTDSKLYKQNMKKILNSSSDDINHNTPIKFLEQIINKNEGLHFSNDYTGVVIAGYEDEVPKLYTFVDGPKKYKYSPKGKDSDEKYYIIPCGSKTKPYHVNRIEVEDKRNNKNISVDCFEQYFGICFCTTKYISDLYGGLIQASSGEELLSFSTCFENMSIQDAEKYSRKLIEYTIKMQEDGDKTVDFPIDTLVITKSGVRWNRAPKSSDNDNTGSVPGNLNI